MKGKFKGDDKNPINKGLEKFMSLLYVGVQNGERQY
jgi:hypothetical protein